MARDAFLKAKEAEDNCVDIIKIANNKAKAILDQAENDGTAKYEAIILHANRQKLDTIEETKSATKAECQFIITKGESEVAKLKKQTDEELSKVVSLIMERIVNIHGDS